MSLHDYPGPDALDPYALTRKEKRAYWTGRWVQEPVVDDLTGSDTLWDNSPGSEPSEAQTP